MMGGMTVFGCSKLQFWEGDTEEADRTEKHSDFLDEEYLGIATVVGHRSCQLASMCSVPV